MTKIMDDFRDGDLAEYTNSNNYTITTDSYTGDYSAEVSNRWSITYTSSGQTFKPGHSCRYYMKITNNGNGHQFCFGVENNEDFYMAQIHEGSEIAIKKRSNGSGSMLQGSGNKANSGEWHECRVDWGTSGSIRFRVWDSNGNQRADISTIDSEYSSDAYGMRGASGKIDYIENLSVSAITKPFEPRNTAIKVNSDDQLTLTWDDPSDWGGEKGSFLIYRETNDNNPTNEIATVDSSTKSYTESGLDDGTKYYYRVKAKNSAGTSDYSITTSGITDLPAPSNFSVDGIAGGTYVLSWTVNADTGNTEVHVSEDGGSSFTTDASLSLSNESHTTNTYDSSHEQLIKLVASTSDANSETATIARRLAGSAAVHDGDGVNTEDSGEVLTD